MTSKRQLKKKFGEFTCSDLIKSIETMALSFSEIINICIDDFKKSDAKQFKGKSNDKKIQMD